MRSCSASATFARERARPAAASRRVPPPASESCTTRCRSTTTHTQVEARLNYAGDKLQLSGGYYGSFLSNNFGALNPGVPSTLNDAVGQPLPAGTGVQAYIGQPVASSPDNSFNYFDLTGAYTFMPELKSNFKLAYSRTTQNQEFASAGLTGAPAGVGNLGGEITSTLAQVRVIGNPMPKLSIVGEYRYQNNEDNTPLQPYSQIGTVDLDQPAGLARSQQREARSHLPLPVLDSGHGRRRLELDRP